MWRSVSSSLLGDSTILSDKINDGNVFTYLDCLISLLLLAPQLLLVSLGNLDLDRGNPRIHRLTTCYLNE